MNPKCMLTKSLPLSSTILPYFGMVDECAYLMQSLSKKSRTLWQSNEQILLRLIHLKRVIKIEHVDEQMIQKLDVKHLKYYVIDTKLEEQFLTLLIKCKLSYNFESGLIKNSQNGLVCERSLLSNRSRCPDFIHIGEHTFDLKDTDSLVEYVKNLQPSEELNQLIHVMTKSSLTRSPVIDYIPEFTLNDSVELSMFHCFERRVKQLEIAAQNYQKQDPLWDQTPFIKEVGVLKIDVKSISFLKQFMNSCDTKVKEIVIVKTPQFNRDLFQFQEELSKTLTESIEKITTNKWFEKSLRRFQNCQTFEVANFPAMENMLMSKHKSLQNIKLSADYASSTITIKNAFVALNRMDCQPVFVKSVTAHFSKEDVTIEGDGTFIRLGGNMIELSGILTSIKSDKLTQRMNEMKDESLGSGKLIVLVHNGQTNDCILPVLKEFNLPKQVFEVCTNSKYIDIKIKKATCKISLNSNSCNALVFDQFNTNFLHFLKVYLHGRCNFSSMKLAQALNLHIVDSLHFEVQKYSDCAKLLQDIEPRLPSSLAKLVITYHDESNMAGDEEKHVFADNLLKKWTKKFSKMQILVESVQSTIEKRVYYLPFMGSCHLSEKARDNCKLAVL